MSDINRVTLVGRLTRDPELRTLPSGTSVLSLGLAVNGRQKDQSGNWIDKPNFFDVSVTVWGNQGEMLCPNHLRERSGCVGNRRSPDFGGSWEAQDGQKRSKVEVVAQSVQFLGTRCSRGVVARPAPATSSLCSPCARNGRSGRRLPGRRRRHSVLRRLSWQHRRTIPTAIAARAGAVQRTSRRLAGPPQVVLLRWRRSCRRGRLQEHQRAPSLRVGEGQDPQPPHQRRVPAATSARSRSR